MRGCCFCDRPSPVSETVFVEQMLHGKHVMVRVGGGWDTLRGFLLKYDPLRVLQFTTLEQKILAFQKGSPCVGGHHANAVPPPPPDMDPLSAVSKLASSSSSSSSSLSSSSSSVPACRATPVGAPSPTCRSYAASPACTPTLPRKCVSATQKKTGPGSQPLPRKPTQLPLPVTTKGYSSLPSSPVVSSRRALSPGVRRKAVTPSSAPVDPSPASRLKLRPSPNGPASQPRSPVCPEPSSKCPKPSGPCPPLAASASPRPVTAPALPQTAKDARPPTGAGQRSRLAQRRPGSPASRLRLEAARRARATALSAPQSRAPTPSSRTASPACAATSKSKEVPSKAAASVPAPRHAAPVPGQVPGVRPGPSPTSSRANQKPAATVQRLGRKQAVATNANKSSVKPEASPGHVQKSSASGAKMQFRKAPQSSGGKSSDPYFEMNSRRRQRT